MTGLHWGIPSAPRMLYDDPGRDGCGSEQSPDGCGSEQSHTVAVQSNLQTVGVQTTTRRQWWGTNITQPGVGIFYLFSELIINCMQPI